MVPSSSEDITRAMRGQPTRLPRNSAWYMRRNGGKVIVYGLISFQSRDVFCTLSCLLVRPGFGLFCARLALELELELYFYLNTVNLSDKIIIKIIIYFTLYKHDLKISIVKIEKNSALHRCRVRFVDSDEEIATTISKRLK